MILVYTCELKQKSMQHTHVVHVHLQHFNKPELVVFFSFEPTVNIVIKAATNDYYFLNN